MKVDCMIGGVDLGSVAAETAAARDAGADGVFAVEIAHDPFITTTLAVENAGSMEVGTKIAVAFARSPMVTAALAHDLNELTGGRFRLGLGTQVKAHITRRFDMPWTAPAPRIREYVQALQAIWNSWRTGERLRFEGEHYRHTLMTPYFTPPTATPRPPAVWLACVGPVMARTAAEVADGLVLHPFWTPRYFEEVLQPAIEQGLERSGRERADIAINAGGFPVTGRTTQQLDRAREEVRSQVAFYGSTPAYRGVLDVHGWGELGDRLHALSVGRDPERWQRMADAVTDEVLAEFAVIAEPAALPAALLARHGYADRITVAPDPELVASIHAASAPHGR